MTAAVGTRSADSALLVVENLEVRYGVSLALRGVSFRVPHNGAVALLGPNGAGKTTCIRSISGLLDVHHGAIRDGDIRLDGKSIRGLRADRTVAAGVAQVPEGRLVFGGLTVEENLRVGGAMRRAADVEDSLLQVYDLFPRLRERRGQRAGWLSGGEQQMVAIGRALMAAPRLLLLDEVSLGLAPLVIEDIFERLREARKELGTAVLLVEQNARVALDFVDYGYILESGRVVLEGRSEALRDDPAIKESYLGGSSSHGERAFARRKLSRRRRRWVW